MAWIALPAEQEGSWRPHWERLLATVAGMVPREWRVIVVTDLDEEEVGVARSLMRFWIEWEDTTMEDFKRAERLWLTMAVAMHVLVGGLEEAQKHEQSSRKGRQGHAPGRGQQRIQAAGGRCDERRMTHADRCAEKADEESGQATQGATLSLA